jgi:hypothetical protein
MGRIQTIGPKDPRDPREDLQYALDHYPSELQIFRVDDLVVEWRRAPRDRRGKVIEGQHGAAILAMRDEVIVNQRGPESERDLIVCIKIPAAVLKQRRSRILLAR